MHYYRMRYYHPGRQRFIGEDPYRFAAGDPNLYVFVRNSPSNLTDPTGFTSDWPAWLRPTDV